MLGEVEETIYTVDEDDEDDEVKVCPTLNLLQRRLVLTNDSDH